MSYRLDLVNRAGLFEYYGQWYSSYELDETHNNVAYRIATIVSSFERIKQLEEECIHQFSLFEESTKINKSSTMINFKSPTTYEIFINISYIISSIRIIQNSILNLIAKEESKQGNKISLPNSMNDFTKKKEKFLINPQIKEIISNYWKYNGKILKDYRDIDEHHNFLIEKVYIDNFNDKNLVIFLPDNPNEKSSKKYRFEKEINAFKFLLAEFYEIEKLLNSISKFYSFSKRDFHYKFYINSENPNNIEIGYDKNNDTLFSIESYKNSQSEIKINNLVYEPSNLDMNTFSFIKLLKVFKNKKSFPKIFKIT